MFSSTEMISTALATFAAAIHLCLGFLAWDPVHKRRAYNFLFFGHCLVAAFFCLGEGLVHSGFFRYHQYWVPSPTLAGYSFPLMYIVALHWLDENFKTSRRELLLLLGGVPGTVYSITTTMLDPVTAKGLHEAYMHSEYLKFVMNSALDHPLGYVMRVSSILHLVCMGYFLVAIAFRLARYFIKPPSAHARQHLKWVIITLAVGTVCLVISAVIPAWFSEVQSSYFGPIATVPLSAFYYKAVVFKRQYYNEVEHQKSELSRYLPTILVDRIIQSKGLENLGGTETTGTILFCDIRSFTRFSESISATETIRVLNLYFTHMNQVIHAHGGVVNKYIGDEIMVLFGLEKDETQGATQAYTCAMAMLKALEEFNARHLPKDLTPFRIGIGMHSGRLVHGNIGSADRMEYTVIGDTVNVAARITSLAGKMELPLLFSARIQDHLGVLAAENELFDEVTLRGRTQSTRVYVPRQFADHMNAALLSAAI